jgi:26S proteasome regulatory subunit N7
MIMIRDFKGGAKLLLDSISTFNSPEIISYSELVFYTVLTSMVSLSRSEIKAKAYKYISTIFPTKNFNKHYHIQKVLHNSEILSNIREIPNLKVFLDSFYKCDYKLFFESFGKEYFKKSSDNICSRVNYNLNLALIIQQVQNDKYLGNHRKYFVREMRVVIYSQFLESYKTVTLDSMAKAFGVSVGFIDKYRN